MAARHAALCVEELPQRILPSVSPVTPASLGQLANPGSTASMLLSGNQGSDGSAALHVLTTVNPGGPMLPAVTVNPGGPMAQTLPITARAQIDIGPIAGGVTKPAQRLVIHDAQELLTATGLSTTQMAADLHVSRIDWHTQMLVLVSEGLDAYGAGSPQVDIAGLNIAQGRLSVQWHLVRPNPDQEMPMWMRLGDPAEVVLTTEFSGPVTFHQTPTITLPAPHALAGSGSGSYAIYSLMAATDPPTALAGSAAPLHVIVGDIGERYDFTGTADLAGLGDVTVIGSINGLGNIATGHATGIVTFSNSHGFVTVDLTGPSQPGFSPLPTQFQYTVVSGTGAYQDVHDQGTLSLMLKPSAQPSAGNSPAAQGTFTLQIP